MVRRGEEGWVNVRGWFFGLLSFVAVASTILSTVLLYSVQPIKLRSANNERNLIKMQQQLVDLTRRVEKNEDVLEVLAKIATDVEWIKSEIKELKDR